MELGSNKKEGNVQVVSHQWKAIKQEDDYQSPWVKLKSTTAISR